MLFRFRRCLTFSVRYSRNPIMQVRRAAQNNSLHGRGRLRAHLCDLPGSSNKIWLLFEESNDGNDKTGNGKDPLGIELY
jgi:hypothetical protein